MGNASPLGTVSAQLDAPKWRMIPCFLVSSLCDAGFPFLQDPDDL
jgi:hypothetical protein